MEAGDRLADIEADVWHWVFCEYKQVLDENTVHDVCVYDIFHKVDQMNSLDAEHEALVAY